MRDYLISLQIESANYYFFLSSGPPLFPRIRRAIDKVVCIELRIPNQRFVIVSLADSKHQNKRDSICRIQTALFFLHCCFPDADS